MDCGRGTFCPFCGKHMSSLTWFCFTCGQCLEFLKEADQAETQGTSRQPDSAKQRQMSYATSLPVFTARPHLVACYSHQPNPKPRGSIKPAVRLGKFFTRVSLQLSEETGAPGRLTSLKLSAMMLYEQMDTGK